MSEPSRANSLNHVKGRNLVVIAGYYGFDNLGDEAILEELINELEDFVERDRIVVLSANPQRTARLYNIRSANRWSPAEFLKLMKETSVLISGGGSLFQDTKGIGSIVFYGMQILLARWHGAKVLIYAQGIGPRVSGQARF